MNDQLFQACNSKDVMPTTTIATSSSDLYFEEDKKFREASCILIDIKICLFHVSLRQRPMNPLWDDSDGISSSVATKTIIDVACDLFRFRIDGVCRRGRHSRWTIIYNNSIQPPDPFSHLPKFSIIDPETGMEVILNVSSTKVSQNSVMFDRSYRSYNAIIHSTVPVSNLLGDSLGYSVSGRNFVIPHYAYHQWRISTRTGVAPSQVSLTCGYLINSGAFLVTLNHRLPETSYPS